MSYITWGCLNFVGLVYVIQNVEADLSLMTKPYFEDGNVLEMLQHLQLSRHKRNTPSEGGTAQCGCQSASNKVTKTNEPEHSVAHHYHHHYHHHYYYCCPSMAKHILANPHLVQAVGQNLPNLNCACRLDCQCMKKGKCVCQDLSGYVSCSCNMTGYCSCSVGSTSDICSEQTKQPKNQNQIDALCFGMMFDDPIGKKFLHFISKNFVQKVYTDQLNKCRSKTTPIYFGFNDPICKEFFNFFSNNFLGKSENKTAVPTEHSQTHTTAPTQVMNQRQNSHRKFGDIKDFDDIRNTFETLRDEMKAVISKLQSEQVKHKEK